MILILEVVKFCHLICVGRCDWSGSLKSQADIDTWHDVLSVLKEDGLRDTLADLDASELDVSDMMFLQDRDIELLTLYLTFNYCPPKMC